MKNKMLTNIKRSIRLFLGHHYPKLLVTMLYRISTHRWLDWKNPRNLNEKIHWLKFNSDTSLWTVLADKYRVRKYIEDKGCPELLVKLYGVWESPKDIDWDSLPNRFVMKTNCGTGDVRICTDKTQVDVKEWTTHFERYLKIKQGYHRGEPHYNHIKPAIIAEELLDYTKQSVPSFSMVDYKIWCFNGKAHHILVCFNRSAKGIELAVFDKDWNYHPEVSKYSKHYKKASFLIPRPSCLEKMIQYAETLSEGLPQARVDFYEVDNKPYFGEITMTSAGGFMSYYTEDFLKEMGNLIRI